jgi:hypothetical protein
MYSRARKADKSIRTGLTKESENALNEGGIGRSDQKNAHLWGDQIPLFLHIRLAYTDRHLTKPI